MLLKTSPEVRRSVLRLSDLPKLVWVFTFELQARGSVANITGSAVVLDLSHMNGCLCRAGLDEALQRGVTQRKAELEHAQSGNRPAHFTQYQAQDKESIRYSKSARCHVKYTPIHHSVPNITHSSLHSQIMAHVTSLKETDFTNQR